MEKLIEYGMMHLRACQPCSRAEIRGFLVEQLVGCDETNGDAVVESFIQQALAANLIVKEPDHDEYDVNWPVAQAYWRTMEVAECVKVATAHKLSTADVASMFNVNADRLNNGGLSEVFGLLLAEGDDAEWIIGWMKREAII